MTVKPKRRWMKSGWMLGCAGALAATLLMGAAPERQPGAARSGPLSPEATGERRHGERVIVGVADRRTARGMVEDEGPENASGFAVLIAEETLRAVGLEPEIRSLRGRDGVDALTAGEIEVAAPISVTPSRLGVVEFTVPIALCRGAVVMRPDSPPLTRLEDLRGVRVVTASGGVGELWCTQAGLEHEVMGRLETALRAVADGRADCLVTLEMAARWEMQDLGMSGLAVHPLEGADHVRAFSLAVRHGDQSLLNALNQGLAVLRDTGRYEQLYQEWAAQYQPAMRPPMVLESTLRWVAGSAVALLSIAALVQLGLYRRLSARTRLMRESEAALRESEERARLMLDNVGVIAWEADPGSFDLAYVSGRAEALTGYTVEEWLGPNFWASHMHEDDREWAVKLCQECTARGESHEFEYRFITRDGRVLYLRDIVSVEAREGKPVRLRGVMVDVTALRESQRALAASEKRFRSMIENSHDGVMMIDAAGRVVYDNGGLERLLGYSAGELMGRPANDVVHPDDLPAMRAHDAEVSARPGEHRATEFRAAHSNGAWRWLETIDSNHLGDPAIGAIVCNYRDITDRKETEEARRRLDREVMQTQKLESLGVLVGGVAHDFNNLLTGVVGNAALALRLLSADDPARACVSQIEAAAARAADLTRNMLAYAGKGRISTRPVDLGHLMRDTLALVSGSVSRSASVRMELGENLPAAECDPAQISQVMMNLVLNASDAIGENRGAIRVRISQEAPGPSDRRDAFPAGWQGRGAMLCLEVDDDGCGMTADVRARIFDPFFTTKFTGRGLGLAAVLGIVRSHGGAVSVRSRIGEGSTFRVWLPLARARAAETPAPTVDAGGASGTVLVVDDERLVLDLVGQALETAGFRVLKASSGPEAIRMLEEQGGPAIDGVLLDLTMPEMDGETALRRVRELRPGLPVVLMSGYSESDVLVRLSGVETKSFLQKPFKIEDLIATARGLVDRGGANEPGHEARASRPVTHGAN